MLVYFNGQFIEQEEVRISPDDRGWVFADGIYEVVRAYNGCAFRMDAHIERLQRSAREIDLNLPAGFDLAAVTARLLEVNQLHDDATVYVQITRGVAPRHHPFPPPDTSPTVYVHARPFRVDPAQYTDGFTVLLVPDQRWARCDVKTINLLPNVIAVEAARRVGAREAVFVRGNAVTEGTHTSVIAIRDGVVLTSSSGENILPSVTRAILMQLCAEQGIPVHAEGLSVPAFLAADEAVLLGTTTELTPIREAKLGIDWPGIVDPVRYDTPGPVTKRLQLAYRELIKRECG